MMPNRVSYFKILNSTLPIPGKGFSVAELLIVLAIMGVLAAFTVPPLFQTPSSSISRKYNESLRDDVFMIVNAYERYRAANPTVPTTMLAKDLTPYMNYISYDTSTASRVDGIYNHSTAALSCSGTYPCLFMPNGSIIRPWNESFGGSNPTNAVLFHIDPDQSTTNTTTLTYPSKTIEVFLTYDGTIQTRGTLTSSMVSSGSTRPLTAYDPPWFTGF